MLQRLQDLSKIIALPAVVLYFCGFFCVMGYLSRFGIVTFDIVNARFLIAGLFALLSMSAAMFCGLYIYTPLRLSIKSGLPQARCLAWALALGLPFVAAYMLETLFKVGAYATTVQHTAFRFSPLLGSADIFGGLLSFQMANAEIEWITKYVLNAALHVGAVVLLAMSLQALYELVERWWLGPIPKFPARGWGPWKRPNPFTWKPPQEASPLAEPVSPAKEGEARIAVPSWIFQPAWIYYVIAVVEILCVTLVITLASYSYFKIKADLFDMGSFADRQVIGTNALGSGVMYAWVYGTVYAIVAAQFLSRVDLGQIAKGETRIPLDNPGTVTDLMVWLVAPLLLSLFFFGATVFPRIPFSIGGGEPREVTIHAKAGTWAPGSVGRTYLLGESSQHFYVVVVGREREGAAYLLAKDVVAFIQTRRVEKPTDKTEQRHAKEQRTLR